MLKRLSSVLLAQSLIVFAAVTVQASPKQRSHRSRFRLLRSSPATSFNQPAPINQCATAPSGSGAGQIKDAGVPIIRMASNSEPVLASVRAGRRPDSDQPQDRFREYEVAGAAHASQNELDFGPAYLDIIAAGAPMPPLTAGFGTRSPLNIGIFQNAAFPNLDRWARSNVA
jgi:hypothetical protein